MPKLTLEDGRPVYVLFGGAVLVYRSVDNPEAVGDFSKMVVYGTAVTVQGTPEKVVAQLREEAR